VNKQGAPAHLAKPEWVWWVSFKEQPVSNC